MKKYYVNDREQNDGDHEVHEEGCQFLPFIASKTYLGEFSNCEPAVTQAKRKYSKSNGCKTCCSKCHTS